MYTRQDWKNVQEWRSQSPPWIFKFICEWFWNGLHSTKIVHSVTTKANFMKKITQETVRQLWASERFVYTYFKSQARLVPRDFFQRLSWIGWLLDFLSGRSSVAYRVDIYYRVLSFYAVVHDFTNISFPRCLNSLKLRLEYLISSDTESGWSEAGKVRGIIDWRGHNLTGARHSDLLLHCVMTVHTEAWD